MSLVRTHVALAAQAPEQFVGIELVLLVGHDARHFEYETRLGRRLMFVKSAATTAASTAAADTAATGTAATDAATDSAHGRVERQHAGGHRAQVVHHQHRDDCGVSDDRGWLCDAFGRGENARGKSARGMGWKKNTAIFRGARTTARDRMYARETRHGRRRRRTVALTGGAPLVTSGNAANGPALRPYRLRGGRAGGGIETRTLNGSANEGRPDRAPPPGIRGWGGARFVRTNFGFPLVPSVNSFRYFNATRTTRYFPTRNAYFH